MTQEQSSKKYNPTDQLKSRITLYTLSLVLVVATVLPVYFIVTFNIVGVVGTILIMILQKLFCHRNKTFINLMIHTCKNYKYFNKFQHIYEEEPKDNERTLYCHHPHSVLPYACMTNMNFIDNKPISKMTVLGSRFMLNIPIVGMFMRMWGVQSVNSQNMEKLMKQGKSIGLVPGGYQEATITSHKVYRLFLKNRKGFVKIALKHGYSLVPVVVLNEHKMYKTTDWGLKTRLWLNKFKIPAVLAFGEYFFFSDHNLQIYNIIGKSIDLPQISKPTYEQVNKWHKIYVDQVLQIYEKYKHLNRNCPLEVF